VVCSIQSNSPALPVRWEMSAPLAVVAPWADRQTSGTVRPARTPFTIDAGFAARLSRKLHEAGRQSGDPALPLLPEHHMTGAMPSGMA
jgi:hypothetical protein